MLMHLFQVNLHARILKAFWTSTLDLRIAQNKVYLTAAVHGLSESNKSFLEYFNACTVVQ